MSLLTQPIPLRTTAALLNFAGLVSIPHIYGTVTINPLKYRSDGRQWLIADHGIQAIEQVSVNGESISSYQLTNTTDTAGHSIALLETFDSLDDGESIRATVRGKEDNGVLIQNPADIFYDILNVVCGQTDVTKAKLSRFKYDNTNIKLSGIINNTSPTLRSQLDEIARSCGAVWSTSIPNIAMQYPVSTLPSHLPTEHELTVLNTENVSCETLQDNIVTVLRVLYGFDYAIADYSGAVTVRAKAQVEKYGEITQDYLAPWCTSAAQAYDLGARILKYRSRPVWRASMSATGKALDVLPSQVVTVNHPHSVLSGRQLVVSNPVDVNSETAQIELEGATGTEPTITTDRIAASFPLIGTIIESSVKNGLATITVTDTEGTPLENATVKIGNAQIPTNAQGQANFILSSGRYQVTIQHPQIGTITRFISV